VRRALSNPPVSDSALATVMLAAASRAINEVSWSPGRSTSAASWTDLLDTVD
jgi:hypothetical protein